MMSDFDTDHPSFSFELPCLVEGEGVLLQQLINYTKYTIGQLTAFDVRPAGGRTGGKLSLRSECGARARASPSCTSML